MVRHECAEALGSIATEDCLPVLHSFSKDSERVVKESCDVALDMHASEHENTFESLEDSIAALLSAGALCT